MANRSLPSPSGRTLAVSALALAVLLYSFFVMQQVLLGVLVSLVVVGSYVAWWAIRADRSEENTG